jgi:hypothetical protein
LIIDKINVLLKQIKELRLQIKAGEIEEMMKQKFEKRCLYLKL